jgi:hypothetical protein
VPPDRYKRKPGRERSWLARVPQDAEIARITVMIIRDKVGVAKRFLVRKLKALEVNNND